MSEVQIEIMIEFERRLKEILENQKQEVSYEKKNN